MERVFKFCVDEGFLVLYNVTRSYKTSLLYFPMNSFIIHSVSPKIMHKLLFETLLGICRPSKSIYNNSLWKIRWGGGVG